MGLTTTHQRSLWRRYDGGGRRWARAASCSSPPTQAAATGIALTVWKHELQQFADDTRVRIHFRPAPASGTRSSIVFAVTSHRIGVVSRCGPLKPLSTQPGIAETRGLPWCRAPGVMVRVFDSGYAGLGLWLTSLFRSPTSAPIQQPCGCLIAAARNSCLTPLCVRCAEPAAPYRALWRQFTNVRARA